MKQIWIIIVCLWIVLTGLIRIAWQMFREGCEWVDKKIDELFEGII